MNTSSCVLPITVTCLLLLAGCRSKPPAPGSSIPTTAPTSAALPGSNDAADAPNAPAVAQSAGGALTTYSDPASGVSFRYPSSWRPWHTGSSMYAPALAQNGGTATITQVFDPSGTSFRNTDLVGLSFSYTVRPTSSASECAQLPQALLPGGHVANTETVNGVAFTRYKAGDAGMCHQMSTTLNSTLHRGACYVFERDIETVCPEIRGPGNPVALTQAQSQTLQQTLDQVMQSVTLR